MSTPGLPSKKLAAFSLNPICSTGITGKSSTLTACVMPKQCHITGSLPATLRSYTVVRTQYDKLEIIVAKNEEPYEGQHQTCRGITQQSLEQQNKLVYLNLWMTWLAHQVMTCTRSKSSRDLLLLDLLIVIWLWSTSSVPPLGSNAVQAVSFWRKLSRKHSRCTFLTHSDRPVWEEKSWNTSKGVEDAYFRLSRRKYLLCPLAQASIPLGTKSIIASRETLSLTVWSHPQILSSKDSSSSNGAVRVCQDDRVWRCHQLVGYWFSCMSNQKWEICSDCSCSCLCH